MEFALPWSTTGRIANSLLCLLKLQYPLRQSSSFRLYLGFPTLGVRTGRILPTGHSALLHRIQTKLS